MMLTAAKNIVTGEIIIGPGMSHDELTAGRDGIWIHGYLDGPDFVPRDEGEAKLKEEWATKPR
jgi:hypothetical protein